MSNHSTTPGLDTDGCDLCGESVGSLSWVASTEGIICYRCHQRRTQTGEAGTQSLSDVFDETDSDGQYLTLEARQDHRYCPHTSEVQDGVSWSTLDSYSWHSSCPECDPGPLDRGDVRRGHSLVAVVTGTLEPEEPVPTAENADARVQIATDGGESADDSTETSGSGGGSA